MIWSLQTLRFAASLLVVYVHASQLGLLMAGERAAYAAQLESVGQTGVDIFFVLSGVVISITAAKEPSASRFFWRRVRRVLPIYWVASLLPALLVVAVGGLQWRETLATISLWPATDILAQPVLPVAWTLTFELLFYGAAALVLTNRVWLPVLAGIFVGSFALRSAGPVFQILGNPLIAEFLLGLVVARLPSWRPARWGVPIGAAALVAVGFLGLGPHDNILQNYSGENNAQRVVVCGIPAALIVYGAMQFNLNRGALTYLGGMSYALYLFQAVGIGIVYALLKSHSIVLPPGAIIALAILSSLVVAWIAHEAIERPMLKALPLDLRPPRSADRDSRLPTPSRPSA